MSLLLENLIGHVPEFFRVETPPRASRLKPGDGNAAEGYVFLRGIRSRDGEPFRLVNVHLAKHVYDIAPGEFSSHVALPALSRLEAVRLSRALPRPLLGLADCRGSLPGHRRRQRRDLRREDHRPGRLYKVRHGAVPRPPHRDVSAGTSGSTCALLPREQLPEEPLDPAPHGGACELARVECARLRSDGLVARKPRLQVARKRTGQMIGNVLHQA